MCSLISLKRPHFRPQPLSPWEEYMAPTQSQEEQRPRGLRAGKAGSLSPGREAPGRQVGERSSSSPLPSIPLPSSLGQNPISSFIAQREHCGRTGHVFICPAFYRDHLRLQKQPLTWEDVSRGFFSPRIFPPNPAYLIWCSGAQILSGFQEVALETKHNPKKIDIIQPALFPF